MVALNPLVAAAVLALLATPRAQGARTFSNSGTLNGWDFVRREHQGTVTQVDNVSYKAGGTALKMTQRYDANYRGRFHSEVDHNYGYRRGDDLFYGFAFRLSDSWQFQDQSYNIAQFIANRPGAGCGGDDWMPSAMLWIQGNQLASRIVSGHYRQPDCGRKVDPLPNLAVVEAGKWHRVVVQARWASDSSGFYKIWFDGKKVLDRRGVATTLDDDSVFQFRVGLYANGWHDDGHIKGSQDFRQVWFDEVAIGTEFKDADPGEQ
ncbi:polysaccharide lyase domain-containing protein [Hirsutella rhossiliensis]|uniref:Polysaccharide lyase domain-containing protein n=1 Tax=Hirsutella rhossiliensis TaxID=111463 RepID=A0A9P8SL39_9HYPO|nr:polysaccharide lyase domain-containing protein [Hirsutella rhossiliensis]KAH0966556.1 polysaccharide lyase domain-containing protein [Hirsutella rhossiliensis]